MKNLTSFFLKKKKFFVELAVVIIVIFCAYLFLSVIYSDSKQSARTANVFMNIGTIKKQAEIYYLSNMKNEYSYGKSISDCRSGVFSDRNISYALFEIAKNIAEPREILCETSFDGGRFAIEINRPFSKHKICIDNTGYTGESKGTFDGTCTK